MLLLEVVVSPTTLVLSEACQLNDEFAISTLLWSTSFKVSPLSIVITLSTPTGSGFTVTV